MAAHAFWERGERPAYYPHPPANNHNEQTIQSAFGYGLDGSGFQKNKQNIIGTATTTRERCKNNERLNREEF